MQGIKNLIETYKKMLGRLRKERTYTDEAYYRNSAHVDMLKNIIEDLENLL